MHQNQYQTLCIARLVECGRLLPRQDCLHHRGHWVHGQGGRLKINIILIQNINIMLVITISPGFGGEASAEHWGEEALPSHQTKVCNINK